MPKEISHIHIAECIAKNSNPDLRPHLKAQERIYSFGSVSPDLFYYDSPAPLLGEASKVAWGEIIHGRDAEDTMAHVVALLDMSRNSRLDQPLRASQLLAFTAGFLTHIAADTIFHPYVYSATGNYYAPDPQERNQAESRHRLFETCMDYHILSRRRQTLEDFALSRRIELRGQEKETVLNAYADALRHGHGIDVDADHVRRIVHRSYGKARTIIGLFQNRTLTAIVLKINKWMNGQLDSIANAGYGAHAAGAHLDFGKLPAIPHPVTGVKMPGGDIEKLLSKSIERGTGFLNAAYDYFEGRTTLKQLRRVLKPYSLNNGLEQVRTDRMQYSSVLPALLIR